VESIFTYLSAENKQGTMMEPWFGQDETVTFLVLQKLGYGLDWRIEMRFQTVTERGSGAQWDL